MAWIDDLANISPSIGPSIHPIRRQQIPTQPFSLARTPPTAASPPLSRANPSAALLPCRRHLRRQILAAASPSDLAAGAPALSPLPHLPSPHWKRRGRSCARAGQAAAPAPRSSRAWTWSSNPMAAAVAAVDRSAMGLDLEFRLLHGVGFQIRAPMGWTWCSIFMALSASAWPSASFCCSSR